MNRKRTLGLAPAEFRVRNRAASVGSDNDGSTLSLDFTTGILDPRLTFTRTTNATFINSLGYFEWANSNMYWNTAFEGLSGSNPSLTSSGWGYALSTGGTAVFNGDGTVTVTTTAAERRAIFRSSGFSGGGLRVFASVDVTIASGSLEASQVIVTGTPTNAQHYVNGVIWNSSHPIWNGGILPVGTQFNIAYATDSVTSGTTSMYFGVGCSSVIAGSATFSNPRWTMWKGSATVPYYPNTSATNNSTADRYKSADYQAPRFDYDPTTRAPRGLLMEGSTTNLVTYSQFAFTGSNPPTGWTSPFTGGPGSAATSTYGTLDGANAWTQNASNTRPMLSSTAIALTTGNTYTVSMYLEAVSGALTYQDVLLLNPSTATLGTPTYRKNGETVLAGDIAEVGRIEATVSCTGSGNANLRCGPGANANCTGGATFSRPQVEVGAQVGSYIPTGASTVARTRDEMTMANISGLAFNQRGGTVFMQLEDNPRDFETFPYFAAFEQSPSGRGWTFARFNNSVSAGRRVFGIAFKPASPNPITLISSSGISRPSGQYKFAASLDTSLARMAIVVNGGSAVVNADTAATMTTIGSLKFNNTTETAATDFSSVWVAQLKYWPIVFANEFLRTITT